ncbi:MAG: acyltransferase [Puniceicoccales bacterium]|jgi:peptidoglycan/LPS O-acetylase OafA/YrhL|nr:acyltransferase [Puniceicoccales bacterium]
MQTKNIHSERTILNDTQLGRSLPAVHENIPALDGLRAVAVVGVILGHVSDLLLPGGGMGVDIFFVLSGFLIASIIHKDLHQGTFSFRQFYLRRIQRLLPNAALTVVVTLLFVWLIAPQWVERLSGRHAIWTLLNLSNIFALRTLGNYWGTAASDAPFTHFWSLGIEEQYYVLFPLVFFCVYKLFRQRNNTMPILIFFAILAVTSFAFCLRETLREPTSAFFLPQFRFWELLAGAALALHVKPFIPVSVNRPRAKSYVKTILGIFCLGVIPLFYFLYDDGLFFPGWVALLPVLASIGVIFSITTSKGIASQLLSFKPVVQVGKYSYSLYLWHWPAIVLARHCLQFEDPTHSALVGALIGIPLAVCAYHLVERPLRICNDGGGGYGDL